MPSLLVLSQPVSACIVIKTSHIGLPTLSAISWRGINRVLSPAPPLGQSSWSPFAIEMIWIHYNYEHISIARENYYPCAITSDGMKSMWDDTDISLFMVLVYLWVLAYYSIPDRLGLYWGFVSHYPTQYNVNIYGFCSKVANQPSFHEMF